MSALPTATGGFGDKPELTFPTPDAPEGLQVEVLVQARARPSRRARPSS